MVQRYPFPHYLGARLASDDDAPVHHRHQSYGHMGGRPALCRCAGRCGDIVPDPGLPAGLRRLARRWRHGGGEPVHGRRQAGEGAELCGACPFELCRAFRGHSRAHLASARPCSGTAPDAGRAYPRHQLHGAHHAHRPAFRLRLAGCRNAVPGGAAGHRASAHRHGRLPAQCLRRPLLRPRMAGLPGLWHGRHSMVDLCGKPYFSRPQRCLPQARRAYRQASSAAAPLAQDRCAVPLQGSSSCLREQHALACGLSGDVRHHGGSAGRRFRSGGPHCGQPHRVASLHAGERLHGHGVHTRGQCPRCRGQGAG